MTDTTIETPTPEAPNDAVDNGEARKPHPWTDTSAHPWRRYLARSIDGVLAGGVAMFIVSAAFYLFAPELAAEIEGALSGTFGGYVYGFVLLALGIPVQALLICAFGGGPGKWLLGVRVTDADGKRLGYGAALWREAKVWTMGLGCGLPFVSLFTLISSYSALEDDAVASWDDQTGDVVTHRPTGVAQTVGIVIGAVLVIVLRLAGVASNFADQITG